MIGKENPNLSDAEKLIHALGVQKAKPAQILARDQTAVTNEKALQILETLKSALGFITVGGGGPITQLTKNLAVGDGNKILVLPTTLYQTEREATDAYVVVLTLSGYKAIKFEVGHPSDPKREQEQKKDLAELETVLRINRGGLLTQSQGWRCSQGFGWQADDPAEINYIIGIGNESYSSRSSIGGHIVDPDSQIIKQAFAQLMQKSKTPQS